MPSSAPRPMATISAVGVASPSAHGQAMISTATAGRNARRRSPRRRPAIRRASARAIASTIGTKTDEIRSTSRWIAGLLGLRPLDRARASAPSRVSAPTRSAPTTSRAGPRSCRREHRVAGPDLDGGRLAGQRRRVDRGRPARRGPSTAIRSARSHDEPLARPAAAGTGTRRSIGAGSEHRHLVRRRRASARITSPARRPGTGLEVAARPARTSQPRPRPRDTAGPRGGAPNPPGAPAGARAVGDHLHERPHRRDDHPERDEGVHRCGPVRRLRAAAGGRATPPTPRRAARARPPRPASTETAARAPGTSPARGPRAGRLNQRQRDSRPRRGRTRSSRPGAGTSSRGPDAGRVAGVLDRLDRRVVGPRRCPISARSVARLTAARTPSSLPSFRSTRPTQAAQVIPPISSSTTRPPAGAAASCTVRSRLTPAMVPHATHTFTPGGSHLGDNPGTGPRSRATVSS